jgi:hypothetical protein
MPREGFEYFFSLSARLVAMLHVAQCPDCLAVIQAMLDDANQVLALFQRARAVGLTFDSSAASCSSSYESSAAVEQIEGRQ